MCPFIEKNPTQFFAVVGAAYLAERHLDSCSHFPERSSWRQRTWLPARVDDLISQHFHAGNVELQ